MPVSRPEMQALEGSSLMLALRPLRAFMDDPGVTELCINRPGELFLESRHGWGRQQMPELTFDWCLRFAKLVANASGQRVDATAPLLTAGLPGGERLQLVLPPATTTGTVAIAIRRPADRHWSIEDLAREGVFRKVRQSGCPSHPGESRLLELLKQRHFEAFMRLAVLNRCNIVISGPTGSGKTTWAKALIREIPAEERLITIEDARELQLERHANHVRLFYSKDEQGVARVSPKQLLECCLRMRPDRVLLAELRGEEAFEYLRNVNSGHPGSITSVHASSALLAFEQLALLVKQSPAGREMPRSDILALLHQFIDVVIQFGRRGRERFIEEIWYEPTRRRQLRTGLDAANL